MGQATLLDSGTSIRIEAKELAAAVKLMLPFAKAGMGLPSMCSGVLITAAEDRIELEATDLDRKVATSVAAHVETPGKVLVSAKLLEGFARTVAGAVTLRVGLDGSAEKLFLACGATSLDLFTLPSDDFPRFDSANAPDVNLTEAWPGVKRVLHALSGRDDKMPSRHVVRIGDGGVCCQNGIGLAAFDVEGLDFPATNIPGDFMNTIVKVAEGEVSARIEELRATIRTDKVEWTTRTTSDSFPEWRGLMRGDGNSPQTLIIGRQELLESLQKLSLLPGESGFHRAELKRIDDELVLSINGKDVGTMTDVIRCSGSFQGDTITVFTPALKALAENAQEDEITFGMQDAFHHMEVHEGPWTAMIQPLRPNMPTPPANAVAATEDEG